jgi:hypothetical protein
MTGPTIGGVLLQAGGWPLIFWMKLIVGLGVSLAVVRIFRGPGERRSEPFDGLVRWRFWWAIRRS